MVDNGDPLQGSVLGEYLACKGVLEGDVHPVYKAINLLDYDVANMGQHELNYGLEFLAEATNDANLPYLMPMYMQKTF